MSDVFTPPSSTSGADLLEQEPPPRGALLILGAIASVLAGAFGAAYALQLMVFIIWYDWVFVVPMLFGVLALAQILAGAFLSRGAAWGAFAAAGLAGLQAVPALGWNVYAVLQTLFSPLGVLWLLLCLPAVVLVPLAIPSALRITAFRRRLYAD